MMARVLWLATAVLLSSVHSTTVSGQQRTEAAVGWSRSSSLSAERAEAVPPGFSATGEVLVAGRRAPSPTRIAASTIAGGLVGAVVLGGAGAVVGSFEGGQNDYFSASAVLGVLGAITGYPLGAGIGAQRGASVEGLRPSLGPILLASLGGAIVGAAVGERIGSMSNGYREQDRLFNAGGAVIGFATHTGITTVVARRVGIRRAAQ